MKKASKKTLSLLCIIIILTTLYACKNEDKSEQPDTAEKIPNTMISASNELEHIITLLGGPLFSGRDTMEKTKNQQLELLSEAVQKSSLGSQEEIALQRDTESQKEESMQEESEDKGEQTGKEEDEGEDTGKKEEDNKGQEKDSQQGAGGEENKKDESEKSTQEENVTDKHDLQLTQDKQKNTTFQHEDSLFGIPKWQEDNWSMIKVLTDGMHFTWNNLQPELFKKGISQNQSDKFSNALGELSHNVNTKSIKDAQNAAFQMSQSLSEFYSYYKTDIPPELKRISSHVTGIHFAVEQNEWSIAQDLANELQQEFTKLKVSVDDNQNNTFQMLELSVNDLCSAVQNQDSVLAIIRTNLVNTNINEFDMKLSQKNEQ